MFNNDSLSDQIIKKALIFNASLSGIFNIEDLKKSPSHVIFGKMAAYSGRGTRKVEGIKQGEVRWSDKAKSAVIIAVEHPDKAPDMDWWLKGFKGLTKGNAKLISVISKLAEWLKKEKGVESIKLPYHIEHGGIFMKDSAVLGGLGCIGKNNILVTPQFGSRVRLRALLLDEELPSTGNLDFDPCPDCEEYCRKACPQKAFDQKMYSAEEYGQSELPGRTGVFSRIRCNKQMEEDAANGKDVEIKGTDKIGYEIRYCRRCEQICPVGRS